LLSLIPKRWSDRSSGNWKYVRGGGVEIEGRGQGGNVRRRGGAASPDVAAARMDSTLDAIRDERAVRIVRVACFCAYLPSWRARHMFVQMCMKGIELTSRWTMPWTSCATGAGLRLVAPRARYPFRRDRRTADGGRTRPAPQLVRREAPDPRRPGTGRDAVRLADGRVGPAGRIPGAERGVPGARGRAGLATGFGRRQGDGYIFYCWVMVGLRPSVPVRSTGRRGARAQHLHQVLPGSSRKAR